MTVPSKGKKTQTQTREKAAVILALCSECQPLRNNPKSHGLTKLLVFSYSLIRILLRPPLPTAQTLEARVEFKIRLIFVFARESFASVSQQAFCSFISRLCMQMKTRERCLTVLMAHQTCSLHMLQLSLCTRDKPPICCFGSLVNHCPYFCLDNVFRGCGDDAISQYWIPTFSASLEVKSSSRVGKGCFFASSTSWQGR